MLRIDSINEMRLVSKSDFEFVDDIANRFRNSSDPEERSIGLVSAAILERLGLKENAPEAATSKGKTNKLTALL